MDKWKSWYPSTFTAANVATPKETAPTPSILLTALTTQPQRAEAGEGK